MSSEGNKKKKTTSPSVVKVRRKLEKNIVDRLMEFCL